MSKAAPSGPSPSKPNKVFVRKDSAAWKSKGWTSAPNSIIHESDMHPMEIWAWIWLASHSDTFELNAQALADANKHVGRDKAYKLVQALEDRGLLLRRHERSETGVPFIVYDLQPEPVPVEQRTTKTRKKATGSTREHPAKRARRSGPSESDSWRVRNPEPTSGNTPPQDSGFLVGQESGSDLHIPDPPGETPIPDPSVPGGSGEFYKEDKTNQQDQPTRADEPPPGPAGGTASNDGWLAEGNPETTSGGQLLRSLPLKTPLPKPVVRSYAGTVNELLASGWTEQALVQEFAGNIPANTTNVIGLVIRRIERTNPKAAKAVKPQADVQARIDALVRQGEAGARMADQILGTRDWHEPERGDLDTRTYLVEVLPTAARAFVEARRAALADAMTNNPAWRN